MTSPAESSENGDRQSSPYAPPPIVDDRPVVTASVLPASLPIGIAVAYSVGATIASGLFLAAISSFANDLGAIALILSPIAMMTGFVLLCLIFFERSGGAIRSRAWKTLITILVPVSSMILFIPTCFGSGMFVFTTLGNVLGAVTIVVPVFMGYLVTCLVVAMRIRSRMARPVDESLPGPYLSIEAEPELRSPVKKEPE